MQFNLGCDISTTFAIISREYRDLAKPGDALWDRDYSKLDLLPFPGVVKSNSGIVNKNYWSCHF